jgi:hypothetical protein
MATIRYHRDGSDVRTVASGLSADEARAWLERKAAEVGQPVIHTGDGPAVNESADEGCGYYYVD